MKSLTTRINESFKESAKETKAFKLFKDEHGYLINSKRDKLSGSGGVNKLVVKKEELEDCLRILNGLYDFYENIDQKVIKDCWETSSLEPYRTFVQDFMVKNSGKKYAIEIVHKTGDYYWNDSKGVVLNKKEAKTYDNRKKAENDLKKSKNDASKELTPSGLSYVRVSVIES